MFICSQSQRVTQLTAQAAKAAPIASTECLAGNRRRDGNPASRAGAHCFSDEKWAELKVGHCQACSSGASTGCAFVRLGLL